MQDLWYAVRNADIVHAVVTLINTDDKIWRPRKIWYGIRDL